MAVPEITKKSSLKAIVREKMIIAIEIGTEGS